LYPKFPPELPSDLTMITACYCSGGTGGTQTPLSFLQQWHFKLCPRF
jgi:hypothetical protein